MPTAPSNRSGNASFLQIIELFVQLVGACVSATDRWPPQSVLRPPVAEQHLVVLTRSTGGIAPVSGKL
jgi:hypothetical protein